MNERTQRAAIVAGAVVLGVLSIVAGTWIALSDDGPARATSTPSPSRRPSPTAEPTPTDAPMTPEPTEGGESPILEDGHHFVYVTNASRLEDGSVTVTFDLAYFLTGEEGEQAAAAHGEEFVNDYYIVNDNPRLRTLLLASEVRVRYLPANDCCELQPGNVDAWLDAILGTAPTDYGGMDVPWWFRVRGGTITRIEQPYLP